MHARMTRSVALATAAASALVGASVALASGPGNTTGNGSGTNGRSPVTVTCDGQTLDVITPNGGNNNGAGQIIDAQGHGIPGTGTFTLTDTTTSTVVITEAFGNSGHRNQEQTECTGTVFEGTASEVFGNDLPPGVAPSDTVVGTVDLFVVLKP